ncbi:MAG: glucosamine-6-phosphate deaminase [Thermoanaerobaculia bacterium]
MRTLILDHEADAVSAAAAIVLAALAEPDGDRDPVVGLPTGRTMVPFYDELARRHTNGAQELVAVRGFNLDELLLPAGHPATFRAYMKHYAWGRTGLDERRAEIPDSEAEPVAECRRYEAALAESGGLDLAILGIGADGHVAYNLPGRSAEETHVVEIPEALARTVDPGGSGPLRAITLGLGALRAAKRIVLLATAAEKAEAVHRLVDGPPDARWPATLLGDHPRLDVVLSRPAAAGLENFHR